MGIAHFSRLQPGPTSPSMLTASMIGIDSCPCPTPTLATASWTVGNSLPSFLSNLYPMSPN